MDRIGKYIGRDCLVTFALTLAVVTFVMSVGAIIRAMDMMARGISGMLLLRFLVQNFPFLLTFSVPMSVLTSLLLVFGRLSQDSEITAMRASGLNIWQIAAAPLLFSIMATVLCLYLTSVAGPQSRHARRQLVLQMGEEDPIGLLDEGRFVRDFPGLLVYVGKKRVPEVHDVVVYEMDRYGVKRIVRAERGELQQQPDDFKLYIDLYDVRIAQPDRRARGDLSRMHHVIADHYPVELDYSDLFGSDRVHKRPTDMVLPELLQAAANIEERYPELEEDELRRQKMGMLVEANTRLALSLSCFSFALLAIPLGIRSHRKESSIGIGIALLLVFFFYLFIIIAESLTARQGVRADLVIWIPVFGAQIGGSLMMHRLR